MYIVFRGQGKLEESSSTFSKPQTTTFLVKPKSLSSQQNPSIDSTAVIKQVLSDECEVQVSNYVNYKSRNKSSKRFFVCLFVCMLFDIVANYVSHKIVFSCQTRMRKF